MIRQNKEPKEEKRIYAKTAEPLAQTIGRLERKGLIIEDKQEAERALRTIGYYRLLIYMRCFQKNTASRDFLPNTKFNYIVELYDFDRAIRLLILDAIERLEVALRAAIINPLAELYSPHWYLERNHYSNENHFNSTLKNIQKETNPSSSKNKKALALTHYYQKYNCPSLPPIWLVCEKLSFGALSKFFSVLNIDRRKIIAKYTWTYPEHLLSSWFRSLSSLRNICAHQDRVWNNSIHSYPPIAHRSYKSDFIPSTTFYSRAVVIQLLLKNLDLNNWWRDELTNLLASCSHVDPKKHLGFPDNWQKNPVWQ